MSIKKPDKKVKRIGIDARFYGPRQKGLGRYVEKLVKNLEKIDHHNQYIIFLKKDNWHEYEPSRSNFKKVLADCHWYTLKEQFFMPMKMWRENLDLIHFPHFNVPLFCFRPFVITIHDLILKRFPTRRASLTGFLRYWIKNKGYQIIINRAVKRAEKIIAVCCYTKQDVISHFASQKINPNKIKVVYEGVPSILRMRGRKSQTEKRRLSFLEKYHIERPYLLYVGNAYPHKNLERLVFSFNELLKEKESLSLVLVGEEDYFYRCLKKKVEPDLLRRHQIIFTDFVSDRELAILYRCAELYVFPSLFEGFGLPPLEAMAYGLPVASSNASCLPEILGPAAAYFNPEEISDIKEKIKMALENEKCRRELVQEGFKRIKLYSWQKMAEEIKNIYESVPFKKAF